MSITVFTCGGPKETCMEPGCGTRATSRCLFVLRGVMAGKACGRHLCAAHGGTAAVCPPHQRLIRQQERAGKGTRE